MRLFNYRWQQGFSLIEVLVTMVILSIGLLGIVGVQSRLQTSEIEAYQRAQALLLVNDMASRIAINRNAAANYVIDVGLPLGAGMTCTALPITPTRKEIDFFEWCEALQGAAETLAGSDVGAMVGARGCVEDLGGGEYLVTVAWQGLVPLIAPPASVACGLNSYNGPPGSTCSDDRCRRLVTTIVRVANL
jgi:type IV pilus assembly protein PilV